MKGKYLLISSKYNKRITFESFANFKDEVIAKLLNNIDLLQIIFIILI